MDRIKERGDWDRTRPVNAEDEKNEEESCEDLHDESNLVAHRKDNVLLQQDLLTERWTMA